MCNPKIDGRSGSHSCVELPLRAGGWRRCRIRSWAHPAVTQGLFGNMSGEDTRPQSPQPFSKCSFRRRLPSDSFCLSGCVWLGTEKRQIRKGPDSVPRGLALGLTWRLSGPAASQSLCLGELSSLSCGMRCEVCGAK